MKRFGLTVLVVALAACGTPSGGDGGDASDSSSSSVESAETPAEDLPEGAVAQGALRVGEPSVGYALSTESTGTAKGKHTIAVVGDLGDAWRVEAEYSRYPGWIMGLVVDKGSGRVTRAVMGRTGQRGREIPVAGAGEAEEATPEGIQEEVEIAIGRFRAIKRIESRGGASVTTWTGVDGELEGVLVKSMNNATGPYELAKMPATQSVELDGAKLEVTVLVYSDGSERWGTKDSVIVALNHGLYKSTVAGPIAFTTTVTGRATDHEPQLTWD